MFKIESYITPLLMGYVDKYVKLKPEDFQLSLWGGDAVLNKLDLRLDVIEKALHLPITLKSGHIHELRIHVPWTKLGSEPVTITINTIECVLKLFDSASETDDASSAKSGKSQQSAKKSKSKPNRKLPKEDLPPGYLQSIVNRVFNNVNIIINNLILKYVEEDIVLSLNIKSGEVYSVDREWKRAFTDLTPEELVLCKVIEFHDLTVCLDKRDSSGKIQTYQDPLVYRCSLVGRVHMTYDNLHASMPSRTRFNVFCEKLDLSITDTQLPMYLRLMELIIAIYYGTLEIPGKNTETNIHVQEEIQAKTVEENMEVQEASLTENEDDGWMSWAWSYVPQILPEDEANEIGWKPEKREPPIFAVGFYISKASVTFKLTETIVETPYFGPQKVMFKPVMRMDAEGISVEMLVKGLVFFDAQVGITTACIQGLGECICGIKDTDNSAQNTVFFTCGASQPAVSKTITYKTDCLFDQDSSENLGERAGYIFDNEQHREKYTENFALRRWGAFWLDYFYIMDEDTEHLSDTDSASSGRSTEDHSTQGLPPETSIMKFLFGPTQLTVSSSMYHRLQKFLYCAANHEYEPYSKEKQEIINENRPIPTAAQILSMETFISTKSIHLTLVNSTINYKIAEHPHCDYSITKVTTPRKSRKVITPRKSRKSTKSKINLDQTKSSYFSLPSIQFQAERFDLQLSKPMYARKLVRLVTKIPVPSGNLMHHCHAHQYMKVFGFQVGLLCFDTSGHPGSVLTLVQPCSAAYYCRTLLLSKYWSNPELVQTETTYELPRLTVNSTRAQSILLQHIINSWSEKKTTITTIQETSLLDDVFKPSAKSFPKGQPLLELSMSGFELKQARNKLITAGAGILGEFKTSVMIMADKEERNITVLQGPVNTKKCSMKALFSDPTEINKIDEDCVNFTYQIPKDTMNSNNIHSVAFLSVGGFASMLDPVLFDWLLYAPRDKTGLSPQLLETPEITIDHAVAQSALPTIPEGSVKSGSTITLPSGTPSQSHTQSQTISKSLKPAAKEETDIKTDKKPKKTWSEIAAEFYCMLRELDVQIDIQSCVGFIPTTSCKQSTSSDILANVSNLLSLEEFFDVLVVNLPELCVCSAGHRPVSALQDIPVKKDSFTSLGEKLPWNVELNNFSVYTLHAGKQSFYLIKPISVTSTFAITNKQDAHGEFTGLALCIHTDMKAVEVKCSNEQIVLLYYLISKMISIISNLQKVLKIVKMEGENEQKSERQSSQKHVDSKAHIEPSSQERDTAIDTYESSREQTPARSFEFDESPKKGPVLSLWVQWTLPKVTAKLYARDKLGDEMCLRTEFEDLSASIDVQEVYAKVKSKVGSLSISHSVKSAEALSWHPGLWEGITLCCTERLTRRFQIVTNKLWTSSNQPIVNMFGMHDSKPHSKEHGFMTITFTRALQRSVQQKYKNLGITSEDILSSEVTENKKRFVHELCINLQPCDVVVDLTILMDMLCVFALPSRKLGALQDVHLCEDSTPKLSAVSKERQKKEKHSMPFITSNSLPLIYINAKNLRVFLPNRKEESSNTATDDTVNDTSLGSTFVPQSKFAKQENLSGRPSHRLAQSFDGIHEKTSQKGALKSHTTIKHDMLMIHCAQFNLTPQVDNPLPRVVINEELYGKAMQTGLTRLPGGALEDRQYQFDIQGLALCTGNWSEMVIKKKQTDLGLESVQNPALEWNLADLKQQEDSIAQLFPIVSNVDLKIVAVPPVVYYPDMAASTLKSESLPVCGYSLEVNATSDLDFCLSSNQVHLLENIIRYHLQSVVRDKSKKKISVEGDGIVGETSHVVDSGIESEASSKVPSNVKECDFGTSESSGVQDITPFDILLTAGKISFMAYSHRRKCQEFGKHEQLYERKMAHDNSFQSPVILAKRKSDLEWKEETSEVVSNENRSDVASVDSHESLSDSTSCSRSSHSTGKSYEASCSSQTSTIDSNVQTPTPRRYNEEVIPFLLATFSQPHTLIRCLPEKHKIELSCFNFSLKGCKTDHRIVDDCKLIPDVGDFSIPWFETLPGESNYKTGIPPALYTLRVNDFLYSPGDVSLRVERPMKLNLCLGKLHQIESFIAELFPNVSHRGKQTTRSKCEVQPTTVKQRPSYLKHLARLQHIEVSTVQLVVAYDAVVNAIPAGLSISYSSFQGDVQFGCNAAEDTVDAITTNLTLRELHVKMNYDKHAHDVIGPFSTDVFCSAQWCCHGGSSWLPRLLVAVEAGLIPVHIGQEHFMCMKLLHKNVDGYMKSHVGRNSKKETNVQDQELSVSTTLEDVQSCQNGAIMFTNFDDLRTGTFQYIMADDCPALFPDPNEIVFCSEADNGCSTMSWCYTEPRAIIKIHVAPVPFTISESLQADFDSVEDHIKPKCCMQYWDKLTKQFIDFCSFHLSEDQSADIILASPSPDDANDDIIVAEVWRVIVMPVETQNSTGCGSATSIVPVSPVSLAACVRVDSCFLSDLVPSVQLSVFVSSIQLKLENHLQHLGKCTPSKLQPFVLDQMVPLVQEYATLTLNKPQLLSSCWSGSNPRISSQVSTSVQCEIAEYRFLTMQKLLEPLDLKSSFILKSKKAKECSCSVTFEPVGLRVGQAAVHTLNHAVQAWQQINNPDCCRLVANYYVICNDTQEVLHLSQVDTDENLSLQPREMSAYSWRSHRKKQSLHLCIEGMGWKWCEPFGIENNGTIVRVIDNKQQRSTLIIKVKPISNVQKQVVICGQLYVASRLSQHLEFKLLTPKQEKTSILGSSQTLASYVVEPKDIVGIRVRPLGVKKPWSHEVAVLGDKSKEHRMVKIPLDSNGGFLHVWCTVVTEDMAGIQQILVLLTPLFVIRSHLPFPVLMNISTPRTQSNHQITFDGWGAERELVGISGDVDHSITFQTSYNSQHSPPAMLTSRHIEQVKWSPMSGQSIEQLCYDWDKPQDETDEYCPASSKTSAETGHIQCGSLPNIEITLDYKQRWAGCNTLLLETAPPYLITNACDVDIVIGQESLTNVIVKKKGHYVPLLPQGRFQIGVLVDNDVHFSPVIELSHEDKSSRRYLPQVQGILYKTGYTHSNIYIKDKHVMCSLTVSSKEGPSSFRIITVQERFALTNNTSFCLDASMTTLPGASTKLTVEECFHNELKIITTMSSSNKLHQDEYVPFPFWCLPIKDKEKSGTSHTSDFKVDGTMVQYTKFKLNEHADKTKTSKDKQHSSARRQLLVEYNSSSIKYNSEIVADSSTSDSSLPATSVEPGDSHHTNENMAANASPNMAEIWSCPVRIRISEGLSRCTFTIPVKKNGCMSSLPCVMSVHDIDGISYMVVSEDLKPDMIIVNNCSFPLNYGQTRLTDGDPDTIVQEEVELITTLPTVFAHSQVSYSFPQTSDDFTELSSSTKPKFHLALAGQVAKHAWSVGIDTCSKHNLFVHIPAAMDAHIQFKSIKGIKHVVIDPVNRAEISAKEIRNRIKGKETSVIIETPRTTPEKETPGTTAQREFYEDMERLPLSDILVKENSKSTTNNPIKLTVDLLFKHMSCVLQDESSVINQIREMLRLTADHVIFSHYPINSEENEEGCQAELVLCIGDFQIDNQLYGQENYDFPVMLLKQPGVVTPNIIDLAPPFFAERLSVIKGQSLLCFDIALKGYQIEGIKVQTQPISLYVEDAFIYDMLKKMECLVPIELSAKTKTKDKGRKLPRTVKILSKSLHKPLKLKYLIIEEMQLLLSVHASLKMFIATDHAPLNFGRFQLENLLTSSHHLTRELTMHFATGALYRAGWVVGSLEILGNPTSLVRNIGTGVADLFRMPYSGLTQGPGAFVSGISQGMTSLVTNISAGTLHSITNFATSVSRNMDRLSLDSDHLERQEESRRQKPEKLSQGIKQGLTGFGISVLGAIAGLADQPIQSLQSETVSSPVQRATGVATGVGKGLMGIVTKPIGGAAEFVSQTGQGLLRSTGLSKMPTRKYPDIVIDITEQANSNLKFVWKMLPSLPNTEFLLAIPASQISPQTSLSVDVILLLTSQLLFVVSSMEDTQQQALAVSEINCKSTYKGTLQITKAAQEKQADGIAKQRVAEFVDKTSNFYAQQDASSDSVGSEPINILTNVQEFGDISEENRLLFLATYQAAKRKDLGKGFSV